MVRANLCMSSLSCDTCGGLALGNKGENLLLGDKVDVILSPQRSGIYGVPGPNGRLAVPCIPRMQYVRTSIGLG